MHPRLSPECWPGVVSDRSVGTCTSDESFLPPFDSSDPFEAGTLYREPNPQELLPHIPTHFHTDDVELRLRKGQGFGDGQSYEGFGGSAGLMWGKVAPSDLRQPQLQYGYLVEFILETFCMWLI